MALTQPTNTGFQQVINVLPAQGQQGDFFGTNPRAILLAGPGIWVAPSGGILAGNFCSANQSTGAVTQAPGTSGAQIGFVHRANNALITSFLGFSTLLIPAGLPVAIFSQGDFWDMFPNGASPGQNVYADPITGAAIAATAAGTAWVGTGYIAAGTVGWTGTGYIVGNTLTVSSTLTGAIAQWQSITLTSPATGETATQINLNPGTYLTAGSGTSWTVSGSPQTVGSAAVPVLLTGTSASQFTASTTGSGSLAVGSVLNGVGVTEGSTILAGSGPYSVTGQQAVFSSGSPGAMGAGGSILTAWKVNSYANPGENALISTWG
jgi:hypothetical protein